MPPGRPRRRPTAGPAYPAIRLRPAPALEPPFDDELPTQRYAGAGTEQLALDLHSSRSPSSGPGAAANPLVAPPTGPSAESWQAARRFVGVCLEILNGYRPTGHVRPFTSPSYASGVVEQLGLARERVTAPPRRDDRPDRPASRAPRPGPPRGIQPRRRDPVRLRALRVCEPRGGVAEAAAVVHVGGRTWALAVRLERHHDRWLCTTIRTV